MTSIIGDKFDFLFKMVVIGDSGVGKTNLLSRFQKNEFTAQSKATIGVEFATKSLKHDNHKLKIQIWDTAGQERYRAITHAYYKGASGSMLVFDLTKRATYENIPKWIKQLKQQGEEDVICILVGNKSDLTAERAVKMNEVVDFATQNKLFYLETSALSGVNVQKAFMTIIKQIYDNKKKKKGGSSIRGSSAQYNSLKQSNKTQQNGKQKQTITLEKPQSQKKKCC